MNFKNLAMWAIIVFLTMGLYNLFKNPQNTSSQNNNITFSEFLEEVDNGRVVQVNIQGNSIKGVYSNGKNFNTYSPNDPNLIEKLTEKGVSISASPIDEKMPSLLGVLLSWFPMLLLIGVWIFFMRQMQGGKGGAMGFGRSKAKLMSDIRKKVSFNDVAGIDEAKEEVQEVVEYLQNPKMALGHSKSGFNNIARFALETSAKEYLTIFSNYFEENVLFCPRFFHFNKSSFPQAKQINATVFPEA